MIAKFELLPTCLLAIGLLQLGPCNVIDAGTSTSGPSSQVQLPRGTIANSRFVKTFTLDKGTFTVTPTTKPERFKNKRSAIDEMWATEEVGGYQAIAVGFGSVTISRNVMGVPKVFRLRAWVGLVHAGASYCPMMTTIPKSPHLPSSGWAAVVIGDQPGSPDVVYQAETFRCAKLSLPSVQIAHEVFSVPWVLTPHGVVAKIPYCGVIIGHGESGQAGSPAFTLRVDVAVPEDTKVLSIGPLPVRCPAAHLGQVDVAATTNTLHASIGPEPMVPVTY